jgi:flagellar hook-length control protein FliK
MQSVTIRPAQVMMEYMAGEQERISQGVSSSGFSKQLQDQQTEVLTRQQNSLTDALIRPQAQGDSGRHVSRSSRKERTTTKKASENGQNSDEQSKVLSSRSVSSETHPTQVWKTAQDLSFSDEAALDEVLNELQLSPDLRDSLKGDALLSGSVSVQQLTAMLDRAVQNEGILAADTKVGAADVRQLMESLQSGQNSSLGDISGLQLKADGFYNLTEFRKLLQRASEQSVQQQGSQTLQGSSGVQGATGSGSATSASIVSGVVTGKLTSQPDSVGILLARSLLDDVTSDEGAESQQEFSTGKVENQPGTITATASSPDQQTSSKVSAPTANQNPGTGTDIQAAVLSSTDGNSSVVTGNTAQASSPGSSQTPTAISESTSQALAGASSAASLSTASSLASVGTTTSAGTGISASTAMSLLKTLEGNGEAVIRGFDFEPEGFRSGNNQQSLAADSALKQAIIEGLAEKIAAPERSGSQTTDQNNEQQLSAFVRQGTLVANPGSLGTAGQSQGTQLSNLNFWSQMLAERVREMQQSTQHRLNLEVDSEQLGRVTLRVETENNQVRAVISTESQQARDILQRSAPQLRQQLAAQGLDLGQLSIDVQDRGSQRDSLPQRSNQQGRNAVGYGSSASGSGQWLLSGAGRQLASPDTIISVFA